jgi:hypothetical protein
MQVTISAIATMTTGPTGTLGVAMAVASAGASGVQGGLQGSGAGAWNCCALTIQGQQNLGKIVTNPAMVAANATNMLAKAGMSAIEHVQNAIVRGEAMVQQLDQIAIGHEQIAQSLLEQGYTQQALVEQAQADYLREQMSWMQDKLAQAQDLFNNAGMDPTQLMAASDAAQQVADVGAQSVSNVNASFGSLDASSGGILSSGGITMLALGAKIGAQLLTQSIFGGTCDSDDILLAMERKAKMAHYIGTRCVEWLRLGFARGCMTKEEAWCSFSSVLARIIQEQGRPQIGKGWGVYGGDTNIVDCSGFTMAELARLDFGRMDFSEFFTLVQQNLADGEVLEWIGKVKVNQRIHPPQP